MVYVSDAGLEVGVATDTGHLRFARTSHSDWTGRVASGEIVMITVPTPEEKKTIRNKINRAVRSRGIKASVRLASTPDGSEVYVVVRT